MYFYVLPIFFLLNHNQSDPFSVCVFLCVLFSLLVFTESALSSVLYSSFSQTLLSNHQKAQVVPCFSFLLTF